MKKELLKKKKYEFVELVNHIKVLPKVWEYSFSDGTDIRLWFDGIYKLGVYQEYLKEIYLILDKYNLIPLTDEEKEQEFINYLNKYHQLPERESGYFSDNSNMSTWYNKYQLDNPQFENIVRTYLTKYQEIDLTTIWPELKQEFINILKQLKRIPKYKEIYLQDNIDIRLVYDKLEQYDPIFFEKLLLHLKTYNIKKLSIDERIKELTSVVLNLGYIPYLQESRFSDGTDMFTWYQRYNSIIPSLKTDLSKYIVLPNDKIIIYSIPKFRNKQGKFYHLEEKEQEKLDLSNIILSENNQKQLEQTTTNMKGRNR